MIFTRIRNILFGGSILRRRAANAGRILFIKSAALGAIEMLRTAALARLLAPADYGLMALAMLVITMLESFSTLGIDVLIQREPGRFRGRLPAYWTIKAARGLFLAFLACLMALPLEWYFNQPGLRFVVWALSLGFLLRGFSGFGVEISQRLMRFGKLAAAEIAVAAIATALGIIAAIWLRNVWSLALVSILTATGACTISFLLFPWRPRLQWNGKLLKSVGIFGGSVAVVNLCNYFFTSFDRAALGKLFDLDAVGYYARAHFLALLPVLYFGNILTPMFLPAFRRMSEDPARLTRAFLKALLLMTAAAGGFAVLFLIFARPIILVVYGERWLPVLPMARILICFGAVKTVGSLLPSIFFLVAAPAFAMAAGLAVMGLPMAKANGAEGMAWAVTISGVAAYAMAMMMAFRLLLTMPTPNMQDGIIQKETDK